MAQAYVQTSPGSKAVSPAFAPVRVTVVQLGSLNVYCTNDVLPVFVTAIVKLTVVPATAVAWTGALSSVMPMVVDGAGHTTVFFTLPLFSPVLPGQVKSPRTTCAPALVACEKTSVKSLPAQVNAVAPA